MHPSIHQIGWQKVYHEIESAQNKPQANICESLPTEILNITLQTRDVKKLFLLKKEATASSTKYQIN